LQQTPTGQFQIRYSKAFQSFFSTKARNAKLKAQSPDIVFAYRSGQEQGVCYWVNQSYKLPATFQYFLGKILTNSKKPIKIITMISYREQAVINTEYGDVLVFLNVNNEIVFDNENEQFLFTLTKEEWEEIKFFVDTRFAEDTQDTNTTK
jgi:hypothetical protein